MIGDPAYLETFVNDDYTGSCDDDLAGTYTYSGACETSMAGGGELGRALAVVSSTNYGDGLYPVYQVLGTAGIEGLFIDFLPGEGGDDEDEDEDEAPYLRLVED
jgi:hypothetical protein